MNQPAQQQQAPQKKTAAQRLDALENAYGSLYQTAEHMVRDLMTIKEALKLLGSKVDAIVTLSVRGEDLNNDAISKVMIENNIEELKGRIDTLIEKGVLIAQEAVQELSFVVGKEVDDKGEVINPRLQFALKAMPEKTQKAILGAKPGDVVTIEEGKSRFELLETYSINQPKVVEAPATEAPVEAAAEQKAEQTTEAPANA